jgi:hypothetical protein
MSAMSCFARSAGRVRETWPWRTSLVTACRQRLSRLFDPYRPELHYMRGPGPKWREKHGFGAVRPNP